MKVFAGNAHGRGFFTPILTDLMHLKDYTKFELHRDRSQPMEPPHKRCLVFKVGDKKILLDGNNTPYPTNSFMTSGIINDFALIIKLQYEPHKVWEEASVPITAWTFTEKKYGIFRNSKELFDKSKKNFDCGFIGRSGGRFHRDRAKIIETFSNMKKIDCSFWRHSERSSKTLTSEEYLNRVMKWKTGLAPVGTYSKGNDGKTWREIELAALGIPMIMEKNRNYWVPLKPHEHYIPIENGNVKEALEQALSDKDLGNRLYQWYLKACSEEGMCKTFAEVLDKYL